MQEERTAVGLMEKPDPPLFTIAPEPPGSADGGAGSNGGAGARRSGARKSESGADSSSGVGLSSPEHNFPSRNGSSSQDSVLYSLGSRSMPASPIQPPGSSARQARSSTGETLSNGARKRLNMGDDSVLDTSVASVESTVSLEESEAEGEPLPPLRYGTPAAPSLAKADVRCLDVEWAAVEEVSGEELVEGEAKPTLCYVLEMQPVPFTRKKDVDDLTLLKSDKWEKLMEGTAREFQVTELKPGLKYAFRVTCNPKASLARRPVEAAGPSHPAVFRTIPAAPSAPNPITLGSKERKALKLKWPVPDETGGFMELKYTLELFPPPNVDVQEAEQPDEPQSFSVVYEGTDTNYKVTKLSPGIQYFVRVRAENDIGAGPYSNVGEFRTAATVPSQPGPPLCYAVGPVCAYLHWLPTQCNGSPITRYHVQMLEITDGGESWLNVYTGPETKCEIINLKAAQRYTFRLISENDVGRSTPSGGLDLITAATCPAPPSSVGVSDITRTSSNLMWHPPSWDGGAPVVHYEVQLFPKSVAALVGGLTANWVPVYQGMDTKCSLFGLRGGCTYRTRVRCYNAVGVSDFSMAAEFTTAADLPEPLLPPSITSSGQTSVHLTWSPPGFDGGAAVKSYVLEMTPEGSNDWALVYSGLELEAEVSRLQPGRQYFFRLHCLNGEGACPWTPPVSSSTRAAGPGQPSVPLLASISSSGISLSWEAPSANGAPITAYLLEEVRIKEDGGIIFVQLYQGADRTFEVKGLTPHQEYGFRLRAVNMAGQSEWGPVAIYRTSAAPPGKPEAVEAYSQAPDGLTVEWKPPLSDNGCPVTLYYVEMASCIGKARKLGSWAQIYQGTGTSCTVDRLNPGKEYACRVRAANKMGEGGFCSPVHCKTLSAAPGPPGAPAFSQRTARSLKVRWEAPLQQNGCLVSTYTLQMAPLGAAANPGSGSGNSWALSTGEEEGLAWQEVYTGVDSSARVPGLQPGQAYAFRVTATNPVGTGPSGPCHAAVTGLSPPQQMVAPTVKAELENEDEGKRRAPQLSVTWQPPLPTDCSSAPLSYEVETVETRAEGEKAAGGEKGRHTITVPKDCCSCIVPGLNGEQWYTVRVRAVGVGGTGHSPWSDGTAARTPFCEPLPSVVSAVEGSADGEDAQPSGKKAGKKARQRKGARGGGEGEEVGGKGKQGGVRSMKSAAAKLPPKRKQALLSRKTLGWAAQVAGGVLLMGLLVFLCMLAYKTEWKPPPSQQRHYLEREWEAARQQELKLQEMNAHADDPYAGISEEDQVKLERLRVIYESAAHYTDKGLEVPEDLVQEAQSLELSPEAYAILSQLDPSYYDDQPYGAPYHDYEDYPGPLHGGPYVGARTMQRGTDDEEDEYEDDEEYEEEEDEEEYGEYRR